VEKLKTDLAERKESVEDKRDNLQKLNEQLQQKLFNFQKLYEEEHRKLQFGNKIEAFIDSYVKEIQKGCGERFCEDSGTGKVQKIGANKDESKRLQVVKKNHQQLKKEEVIEKITETNEKLEEKRKTDRALWMKVGQRVRITGSTSVEQLKKFQENKVIVNYGTFKTTIDADDLKEFNEMITVSTHITFKDFLMFNVKNSLTRILVFPLLALAFFL
jgi:DNA mismatch repair protein MutS2